MSLTNEQMTLLHEAKEVHIETRPDGESTTKTIIWIVVAGDKVYIRSVRGQSGRWYQRALADPEVIIHADEEEIAFRAVPVEDPAEIETVTRALRDKYRPGGSLDRMTRDEVLDTTLRLEPTS